MRILFIGSSRTDYLQDLTYSGLIKLVGARNLVQLHLQPRYHLTVKSYPKNIPTSHKGILNTLLRRKGEFDLVVVAAAKPDCFKRYIDIAGNLDKDVPVLFIDGGDREDIGGDIDRLGKPELFEQALNIRPFTAVFKREYIEGGKYDENVFPLPLSFNFDRMPAGPRPKKYDVTFWAVEGHPIRTKVLDMLQGQFDCTENGSVRDLQFQKYKRTGRFYLKELASSRIALSFRGGGWDTLRYWEIPAAGSLMISQPMPILIPDNFRHEKEAVYCRDDASDLLELCSYYLKNEKKREEIASRGAAHARVYHSDRSRAAYILKKLEEISR